MKSHTLGQYLSQFLRVGVNDNAPLFDLPVKQVSYTLEDSTMPNKIYEPDVDNMYYRPKVKVKWMPFSGYFDIDGVRLSPNSQIIVFSGNSYKFYVVSTGNNVGLYHVLTDGTVETILDPKNSFTHDYNTLVNKMKTENVPEGVISVMERHFIFKRHDK